MAPWPQTQSEEDTNLARYPRHNFFPLVPATKGGLGYRAIELFQDITQEDEEHIRDCLAWAHSMLHTTISEQQLRAARHSVGCISDRHRFRGMILYTVVSTANTVKKPIT